jgi:hypothetical protein
MQPGNLYQPAQAAFAANGQPQLSALQPVANEQLVTVAAMAKQLKGLGGDSSAATATQQTAHSRAFSGILLSSVRHLKMV